MNENENITETKSLIYPYQAENNIRIVLSNRLTEENKKLFLDSLKFLMYGEHNIFNGEPKLKPSIKRIWSISELDKSQNNRKKISSLLSNFKKSNQIEIKQNCNVKPIWRLLSNGTQIKSRYAELSNYINQVN
jgi:hypothetical protein